MSDENQNEENRESLLNKKENKIMAKVKNFKTIFPAVSVPLNEDYSINEPEFRAYLRWIKSFYGKGMDGLVCNGHTGEITGLTRAERKRVVEICAEECGDVMTIISGVNCENTAESIEMAKEAKEEGFDHIAFLFAEVAKIEKEHEERYKKLLENVEDGLVFSKDGDRIWKCRNCGHIVIGKSAPQVCPVCAHPKAYFEIKAENY